MKIHLEQIKTNDKFHGGKNQVSYIQDSWKTCNELVIGLFAELVNREMMWTIGEIVSENNSTKRMRIIKQFIKIARQCKETQNFNSMFAIISGLGHGAVSRLKSSWEKLPTKYQRLVPIIKVVFIYQVLFQFWCIWLLVLIMSF